VTNQTATSEETSSAFGLSDKLYRMMRYRRGLFPAGRRLPPVGAPELDLVRELDIRIEAQSRLEGFSEAQAWTIFDSPSCQKPRGASVVGQHVLSEGYLTTYADGTYVLCGWQAAP
jgi:hypothetical protein